MSKRGHGGFKAPQAASSHSKGKKARLQKSTMLAQGRVEMHATGEDKATMLEDEFEETEHSKYALSSDEELDSTIDKQGKIKIKTKTKKSVRINEDANTVKIDRSQGEEDATDPDHKFIDDQEFTPFNLEEEREEGKFTEDGRYEWEDDKDEKTGADEWLATTNWKSVDQMDPAKRKEYRSKFDRDQAILNNDGAITYAKGDVLTTVNQIITLILPHETVAGALKRLRPKINKGRAKKKQQKNMRDNKYGFGGDKKGDKMDVVEEATAEELDDAKQLQTLSDLANQIAGSGYYEVYSDSVSQLQTYADKLQKEIGHTSKAVDDDLDDMFSDPAPKKPSGDSAPSETMWEYRWGDAGDLFGPFKNSEMIEWKDAGFFAETDQPAMCRRVKTSNFYDAKRTDFELWE